METYLLIGGIGSGKSTAARLFEESGALCIDLDLLGREVLALTQVKMELAEAFGQEVLDGAGEVDRARLAQVAFSSDDASQQLGTITQPHIIALALQLLEECAADYQVAIVEVSAYTPASSSLSRLEDVSSGIIAVVAPEELRIQRAIARGMDEADVRARLACQATDEKRREWADYVIDNSADLEHLKAQVSHIWEQVC